MIQNDTNASYYTSSHVCTSWHKSRINNQKTKPVRTTYYDRYFLFVYHKITLNIGKTVYLVVPSRSLRSLSQVAQCHAGNSLRK